MVLPGGGLLVGVADERPVVIGERRRRVEVPGSFGLGREETSGLRGEVGDGDLFRRLRQRVEVGGGLDAHGLEVGEIVGLGDRGGLAAA